MSGENMKRKLKIYGEKLTEQEKRILEDNIKFSNEYLSTMSFGNYVESIGKKLSDFTFKNVDCSIEDRGLLEKVIISCKLGITKKARGLGAIKVTDLKPVMSSSYSYSNRVYMIGTAVIPKASEKPSEN